MEGGQTSSCGDHGARPAMAGGLDGVVWKGLSGLGPVATGKSSHRNRTTAPRPLAVPVVDASCYVPRYARWPSALRRSTLLCQKGGPRFGARVGASSASSVDARNLQMLLASVTIARSFTRPLHLGH